MTKDPYLRYQQLCARQCKECLWQLWLQHFWMLTFTGAYRERDRIRLKGEQFLVSTN